MSVTWLPFQLMQDKTASPVSVWRPDEADVRVDPRSYLHTPCDPTWPDLRLRCRGEPTTRGDDGRKWIVSFSRHFGFYSFLCFFLIYNFLLSFYCIFYCIFLLTFFKLRKFILHKFRIFHPQKNVPLGNTRPSSFLYVI